MPAGGSHCHGATGGGLKPGWMNRTFKPSPSCTVTAEAVTVRAGPRPTATAISSAYRSDRCTWIDVTSNGSGCWDKVTIKRTGVTGWVRGDLVNVTGSVPVCVY